MEATLVSGYSADLYISGLLDMYFVRSLITESSFLEYAADLFLLVQ